MQCANRLGASTLGPPTRRSVAFQQVHRRRQHSRTEVLSTGNRSGSNFAGGYWGLTWAQIGEASIFRRRNVAETLRSVEALARRAVALDGSDAEARSSLGLTPSNQLACCFTRKECQQWHNPIRLTSQPSGRRIQGSRGFRAYCAGSYLERAARTPRQTRRSMTVGSIRAIGECREALLPL